MVLEEKVAQVDGRQLCGGLLRHDLVRGDRPRRDISGARPGQQKSEGDKKTSRSMHHDDYLRSDSSRERRSSCVLLDQYCAAVSGSRKRTFTRYCWASEGKPSTREGRRSRSSRVVSCVFGTAVNQFDISLTRTC